MIYLVENGYTALQKQNIDVKHDMSQKQQCVTSKCYCKIPVNEDFENQEISSGVEKSGNIMSYIEEIMEIALKEWI